MTTGEQQNVCVRVRIWTRISIGYSHESGGFLPSMRKQRKIRNEDADASSFDIQDRRLGYKWGTRKIRGTSIFFSSVDLRAALMFHVRPIYRFVTHATMNQEHFFRS